jgi:gluconate 2-dehydrogenase gamma chain
MSYLYYYKNSVFQHTFDKKWVSALQATEQSSPSVLKIDADWRSFAMENKEHQPTETTNKSRREFLKNSGIAVGGIAVGGALGGVLGLYGNEQEAPAETAAPQPAPQHDHALQYFTNRADFEKLAQATERIFPEDDNGPGAIALGVPYYIDHQLAGQWGINAKEYRQGPFYEGTPEQGYQSQLLHHQVFDHGLAALDRYSEDNYGDIFVSLGGEEQDEVLQAFENDEVQIPGLSSSLFFELLRSLTIEGIYADPLYGGNKDMAGWKMKEYPGVQLSYTDHVEEEEFLQIEPKSLHDTHN